MQDTFNTSRLVQKYRVEWHLEDGRKASISEGEHSSPHGNGAIRQSTVTLYGRDSLRSINEAIVNELCTRTGHSSDDIVLDLVTERS